MSEELKAKRDLAVWSAMSWLIGHYEGTHGEPPPPFVMQAYRAFGERYDTTNQDRE